MERGYATVVREWIRHPAFSAACSDHDLQRCEQLLEVADTLTATGAFYRYRMRLDGRLTRLIELLAPIEDLRVRRPQHRNQDLPLEGGGLPVDVEELGEPGRPAVLQDVAIATPDR